MKKGKLHFIIIIIIFIFLSFPPSLPIALGEVKIEIGFSPKRLFDVNIGTPIFMPSEQLWINVFNEASVRLKNPLGSVVRSLRIAPNTPTLVYTFNPSDIQGVWQLEVISMARTRVLPIYVEGAALNIDAEPPRFTLQNDTLLIQGFITTKNINHEGGLILLVDQKVENQTTTISSKSTLEGMPIYLDIVQTPSQPGVLILKPYATGLSFTTSALAWAEISLNLPLIKGEGDRSAIIYMSELVTRTPKILLNITATPNEVIKLRLPKIHEVDRSGTVPFRPSIGLITFYLQIDDLIYTLNTKFLFIPEAFNKSIKELVTLHPFSNILPYRFSLDLQNLSKYQIILILKVNGVDKVWSMSITP
ncbi:MAG: hypothetical protein N3F06_03370, partial [Nitrososphaerales archaeon]|nr:hypothetical protein [Nitrososphaerales archaeon]